MTKRTSKTGQPKKPRAKATKPKVGGARTGSGPKPKLGVGAVRSVIKTVRLSHGEHDAQLAAVVRAGAKDWAEWARPILNAAALPGGTYSSGGRSGSGITTIEVGGQTATAKPGEIVTVAVPSTPSQHEGAGNGLDRLQMSQVEAASGHELVVRPIEPAKDDEIARPG